MKMFFQNKKTKGLYKVLFEEAINCTNAQDGQIMVIYTNGKEIFARDQKEFKEKFETFGTLGERELENDELKEENAKLKERVEKLELLTEQYDKLCWKLDAMLEKLEGKQ